MYPYHRKKNYEQDTQNKGRDASEDGSEEDRGIVDGGVLPQSRRHAEGDADDREKAGQG